MKIHIIKMENKRTGRIKLSDIGFSTIEKARNFISSKVSKPVEVKENVFESESFVYWIEEITIL